MSKQDIKIWQRSLAKAGLYSGRIDGDFGKGTRRASFEAVNIEVHSSEVVSGSATLLMANHKATRNKPVSNSLKVSLINAVTAVYGADTRIVVYSGGQDRKGRGSRRTGSVRHDDYGQGGRAADCYIYVSGRKIYGVELAKLGQYWLAKKLGACGLEMATGGIHLDEWTKPPRGGGMYWTYSYSNKKSWGKKVRAMLVSGNQGHLPKI